MHQALYRKWRPQVFGDVYGQDHITSVLKYEVANGKFSHAYLFCGSRGTGKTTCAKILAKAVNCESPVDGSPCGCCEACRLIENSAVTDILEMDAASNNGVDNIRDIRDEVNYAPVNLRYRVYIIDEVHMLSASAFNALLKTLEEPPAHVIFILATTELQKLPATIISRCQRFDFHRIATADLTARLLYIAKEEHIEIDEDAAVQIAKAAQGGMRDAISLLELCAGNREKITVETVMTTIGSEGRGALVELLNAVLDKNYEKIFAAVHRVVESARDLLIFWQDLISLYRDLLVVKSTPDYASYLDLTDSEKEELSSLAARFTKEKLLFHATLLSDAFLAMQRANTIKRLTVEMTLMRMSDETMDASPTAILSRLAAIEDRVARIGVPDGKAEAAPEKKPNEPEKIKKTGEGATTDEATDKADETNAAKAALAVSKQTATADGKTLEKAVNAPKEKAKPIAPAAKVGSEKSAKARLDCWPEVIERVAGQDYMVSSFIRKARAYEESGRIFVLMENDFLAEQISAPSSVRVLSEALSYFLKKPIASTDIVFSVATPQDLESFSALDELAMETDQ